MSDGSSWSPSNSLDPVAGPILDPSAVVIAFDDAVVC
jgi:hypothetical protein